MAIRSTLGGFSADLDAFSKQLGVGLDTTVRKVAIDIHDGVILKTPRDTGRAAVSWNIQAGTPDNSVEPPRSDNSGAANATGEAQAKQSRIVPGDGMGAIYITNSLPYIERLEFGYSKQSPQGMVRVTLSEVEAEIRAAQR